MMPLRFGNHRESERAHIKQSSLELAQKNFLKIQERTQTLLTADGSLAGNATIETSEILANLAQATGVRINFNA